MSEKVVIPPPQDLDALVYGIGSSIEALLTIKPMADFSAAEVFEMLTAGIISSLEELAKADPLLGGMVLNRLVEFNPQAFDLVLEQIEQMAKGRPHPLLKSAPLLKKQAKERRKRNA